MKAIHALKIVLKDTIMSREREYLEEAIKELENIEKEKFVDKFTYTSCEDCVNKDEDVYLEVCGNCRHFYGCSFEKKEDL